MRVRLIIEFDWETRFGELPLNKAEVIEGIEDNDDFINFILKKPFTVSVEEVSSDAK